MGTTLDALRTENGVAIQWVLVIEGHDVLLTDGDPSAATAAWAEAGEWTSAISGLFITSGFEQSYNPWDPFVPAADLTFVVRDVDGADSFGTLVLKRGGTTPTHLTTSVTPKSVTLPVQSSAAFPSSGTAFLGTERITYTGKGATTLTGCTRGRCAPFASDNEVNARFGRSHRAGVSAGGTGINPVVDTSCRSWEGKWVGLWMHRRLGGVLDTRSQAQLVWAGTITEIIDTANGDTQVTCRHVTAVVPETMLLRDQWSAEVQEGVYLHLPPVWPGFDLRVVSFTIAGDVYAETLQYADTLVVTTGAAGANQIEAGYHSVDSIITALNAWLAAALAADDIGMRVVISRQADAEGGLVKIEWRWVGLGYKGGFRLSMPAHVLRALGFEPTDQRAATAMLDTPALQSGEVFATSPPLAAAVWGRGGLAGTMDVLNVDGTFIDQSDTLPFQARALAETLGSTSDPLGFVMVGAAVFLARQVSASSLTLIAVPDFNNLSRAQLAEEATLTASEAGPLMVRQVIILAGSFANLMPRIFASTGNAEYNHDVYDAYGYGLGAAIPWELLGQSFVDSCFMLDQAQVAPGMLVVIERPTRLGAVFKADLLLRRASLVWKNGGLRFTSWSTPSVDRALHELTEDNKNAPADQRDAQRTPLIATDKWLVNTIKVEYDRVVFEDAYRSFIQLVDRASIDDLGDERGLTIQARNAYGIVASTGAVVEALSATLLALLPVFARPILMLRRTIDMSLFENVAPGDLVTINDLYARDPSTGRRGLVDKPGIILTHRWNRGGADPAAPKTPRPMFGEVDIAIDVVDRAFTWSPAALVDDSANSGGFTAGYNSGTLTIRCKANEYTLSADGIVDVSYFGIGDLVYVVEVDPAGGTSQAWTDRTILAKSSNDLTLDSALTGFDTGKKYRVIQAQYADIGGSQRVHAFQADSADDLIQNEDPAHLWASDFTLEGNQPPGWVLTELPERYSSMSIGDGVPLDVGFETGLIRMVTNLQQYKTAPQVPPMDHTSRTWGAVAGDWKLVGVVPYFTGPTRFPPGYTRLLYVAPHFSSSSGTSQVRITISNFPPAGDSLDDVTILGTQDSVTFSSSSATAATPTAQGLSSEVTMEGPCFLIVEVDSTAAVVYGLGELRLGPLEAV